MMTRIAADAAGNTAVWVSPAGVLLGVLLTGLLGLATAWLNHRWQSASAKQRSAEDHARQLRQERREIYANYWLSWDRLDHQIQVLSSNVKPANAVLSPDRLASNNPWADPHEVVDDEEWLADSNIADEMQSAKLAWLQASGPLFLVAGQAVVDAARAHKEATERRLAAWEGRLNDNECDAARWTLNDAMRSEVQAATQP